MDERRVSPLILAAVVLAAMLPLYIAGYFRLSNPGSVTSYRVPAQLARFFPNHVRAEIYRPAAAAGAAGDADTAE